MIRLQKEILKEIKTILRRHVPGLEVRAFGSRVTGRARTFSDLDLLVRGRRAVGLGGIGRLKEAFSESDMPILVDVMDWHDISESFRKIVQENSEIIQMAAR